MPQKKAFKTAAEKKKTPVKKKEDVLGNNLVTIAELSKRTGVSIRMLRHLQQQGVIEPEVISKGKESLYNFAACLAKMFAYYRDKADSRKSGDSTEMADEKLKQITAKRLLEEIKVQRLRGELHHTEDIRRIVGALFSRIHTGLESFPLGIAPRLVKKTDAAKIAEIIRKRLSRVLYEITVFDFESYKKADASYYSQLEAEEEDDDDEPD